MTTYVKPERFYALPPVTSLNDIKLGDILTGVLFRYIPFQKVGLVNFGNNIIGEISLYDFSLQKFDNDLEAEKNLFYKIDHKIAVEVIDFSDNGPILSRKNLQQSALNYLSNSIGTNISASIETINSLGIWIDIGNGITSLLRPIEYSSTRFYNFEKFLSIGDSITVKILDYDESTKHFTVSRKQADIMTNEELVIGNTYYVIPSKPVDDIPSGYFVEYSPNIAGILDVPNGIILKEGVPVKGYFKNINSKGLKFNFRF